MHLLSCRNCAVVLDVDAIHFPDVYDHDSGEVIKENVEWNDDVDQYVPISHCPVCGEIVRREF